MRPFPDDATPTNHSLTFAFLCQLERVANIVPEIHLDHPFSICSSPEVKPTVKCNEICCHDYFCITHNKVIKCSHCKISFNWCGDCDSKGTCVCCTAWPAECKHPQQWWWWWSRHCWLPHLIFINHASSKFKLVMILLGQVGSCYMRSIGWLLYYCCILSSFLGGKYDDKG